MSESSVQILYAACARLRSMLSGLIFPFVVCTVCYIVVTVCCRFAQQNAMRTGRAFALLSRNYVVYLSRISSRGLGIHFYRNSKRGKNRRKRLSNSISGLRIIEWIHQPPMTRFFSLLSLAISQTFLFRILFVPRSALSFPHFWKWFVAFSFLSMPSYGFTFSLRTRRTRANLFHNKK